MKLREGRAGGVGKGGGVSRYASSKGVEGSWGGEGRRGLRLLLERRDIGPGLG